MLSEIMTTSFIRTAVRTDVPAITEIYNSAVLKTTATFDTEPKTVEERTGWFDAHDSGHPVIVYELDGEVVGWAALGKYSPKKAYAGTAELSVYVSEGFRGRGIGKSLTVEILRRGKKTGIRAVLSRIASDNAVSIRLHEDLGFFLAGTLREVGVKFGMVLDVHIYQILL